MTPPHRFHPPAASPRPSLSRHRPPAPDQHTPSAGIGDTAEVRAAATPTRLRRAWRHRQGRPRVAISFPGRPSVCRRQTLRAPGLPAPAILATLLALLALAIGTGTQNALAMTPPQYTDSPPSAVSNHPDEPPSAGTKSSAAPRSSSANAPAKSEGSPSPPPASEPGSPSAQSSPTPAPAAGAGTAANHAATHDHPQGASSKGAHKHRAKTEPADNGTDSGSSPLIPVLIAIVALAAASLVAVAVRRRRTADRPDAKVEGL